MVRRASTLTRVLHSHFTHYSAKYFFRFLRLSAQQKTVKRRKETSPAKFTSVLIYTRFCCQAPPELQLSPACVTAFGFETCRVSQPPARATISRTSARLQPEVTKPRWRRARRFPFELLDKKKKTHDREELIVEKKFAHRLLKQKGEKTDFVRI